MEFQDKLDGIWKRISDEEFLANRGTGGEVRYYVFDYDASMELIVRDKIRQLRKQNNLDLRLLSMICIRWYWTF